jgi:hypothetical protein
LADDRRSSMDAAIRGRARWEVRVMFEAFHLLLILLPLALGAVHVLRRRSPHPVRWVAETFLLYYLVIGVGVQGLLAGMQQLFASERVAEYVGWPDSPFVHELGSMNLAFGLLGVLCIWVRGTWWHATAIGYSLFLAMAAGGHIADLVVNDNTSAGNVGPTLWADIYLPVAILGLLAVRHWLDRARPQAMVAGEARAA